jgi:hypothetical protein
MSHRSRMALLLALLLAAACSSGDKCDPCATDTDCKAGYVCSKFSDGKMYCGSGQGTSQCRVVGF